METHKAAFEIRQVEVKQLLRWARAGESASIVGVSGVGKSNLFNALLDPRLFENEPADGLCLVHVNFHDLPDYSLRSICSLILDQLEQTLAGKLPEPGELERIQAIHECLLESQDDVLKVQHYFKRALRAIMADEKCKLILLCDQFDQVYREADDIVFANLRGIRDAYKYRLAYFVFTRLPLDRLVELDPGREEFHELMASNLLWLRPYNPQDAGWVVGRIATRHGCVIDEQTGFRIYQLSGGHGGLLRAVLLQQINSGVPAPNTKLEITAWTSLPNISLECARLWNSLTLGERRLLKSLADDRAVNSKSDSQSWCDLQDKGLVDNQGNVCSSLLECFAGLQDAPWEQPLTIDSEAGRVWVCGMEGERLVGREIALVKYLLEHAGEIISQNELIHAGWPDVQEKSGVSSQSVAAAIYRLRKKIEREPDRPPLIETLRGQGYRLVLE